MARTKPTDRDPTPNIAIGVTGVEMANAEIAVDNACYGNTTVIDKAVAARIAATAARIIYVTGCCICTK